MNPLNWLRRKVSEAVVSGVADGLRAVAPDDEPAPVSVDELRALLARAVPDAKSLPAAEDEPAKGRKVKT